jgi:Resolvase, N terminal domain/Recombinase
MARTAIAYLQKPDTRATLGPMAVPGGRELELVAIVEDGAGPLRSGIAEALRRIAAGQATTLMTPRLGALSDSLRGLLALLDWLQAARADLLALDVELDTATATGRRMVGVLREIERWEREPEPGRPPRGRPGLATRAPELSERVVAMRERGMSLQAIADALNAEGVATQRGGALWRPSSVQSALGYRRPRPPLPGAPPPPPAHGRPGPAPDPPGRGRPPHTPAPRR